MDYKYHLGNRFGACQVIAHARDEHRGRDIRLYHMPGNFEYVGVNDGIDVWICPVAADPFSAGCARLFEDIRKGKPIEAPVRRRAIVGRSDGPPLPSAQPAVKERRRVVLAHPEPVVRSRHVIRA